MLTSISGGALGIITLMIIANALGSLPGDPLAGGYPLALGLALAPPLAAGMAATWAGRYLARNQRL